jgi:hypothetical protein
MSIGVDGVFDIRIVENTIAGGPVGDGNPVNQTVRE